MLCPVLRIDLLSARVRFPLFIAAVLLQAEIGPEGVISMDAALTLHKEVTYCCPVSS